MLIVRKHVAARMGPPVIHRMALVRARLAGRVSIAHVAGVPIICTARHATKHANARKKIQKCVIHGRENAIARLAGAAYYAIDRAHF